jgi:hypothetical protein
MDDVLTPTYPSNHPFRIAGCTFYGDIISSVHDVQGIFNDHMLLIDELCWILLGSVGFCWALVGILLGYCWDMLG